MSAQSIQPAGKPIDAVVRPPGSKSLSNRGLVVAALAKGRSVLSNFLFADDTQHFLNGLAKLGIALETDQGSNRVVISGCAGHLPASDANIDCGESGTMLRFFAALCATSIGEYRLYGRGRLHDRPMGPLVRTLRRLGALVEFEDREDHAPLIIHARGLRGGEVEIDTSLSSQFASAILLAGPSARNDVMLKVTGDPVSHPYVVMTCSMMDAFGVPCITEDYRRIIVPAPQIYQATGYYIEPDATGAGYFLAAAAICGGRVRIEELGMGSCQGDLGFVSLLTEMGCKTELREDAIVVERKADAAGLRGGTWDLGAMPDIAPTVAVLGLFADSATHIRNVPHLKYKESDRLAALASQLKRLGAEVELLSDGLSVHPPPRIKAGALDSFGDHRIAMALALVGLAVEGITIRDPECVSKSFPGFFGRLHDLTN